MANELGYSSIGGTSAGLSVAPAAYQIANLATAGSSFTAATISQYLSAPSPTGVTFGIYADSSGAIGAKLGDTAEATATSTPGWVVGTLHSPVTITSGSKYWLLSSHASGNITYYYDATLDGAIYAANAYSAGSTATTPNGGGGYNSGQYSIYAADGGGSTASGDGTAAGVASASAVGASTARSAGSAAGVASAAGVYPSTAYDLTDLTISGVSVQLEGGMAVGTLHFPVTSVASEWVDGAIRFKGTFSGLSATIRQEGSTVPIRVSVDGVDVAVYTNPSGSGVHTPLALGSSYDSAHEHEYIISGGLGWSVTALQVTGGSINTARLQARPVLAGYGDSITQGTSGGAGLDSTTSWLHKTGLLLGMQVYNRGLAGTTVSNTVGTAAQTGQNRTADLTGMLPAPSAVVLLYGINDLNNSVSGGTFSAAYLDMVGKIQDGCPGAYIVCERLLKQGVGDTAPDVFSSDISSVVAALNNPRVVSDQSMHDAYDGADLIHPGAAASTTIAAALAPALANIMAPTPATVAAAVWSYVNRTTTP